MKLDKCYQMTKRLADKLERIIDKSDDEGLTLTPAERAMIERPIEDEDTPTRPNQTIGV